MEFAKIVQRSTGPELATKVSRVKVKFLTELCNAEMTCFHFSPPSLIHNCGAAFCRVASHQVGYIYAQGPSMDTEHLREKNRQNIFQNTI